MNSLELKLAKKSNGSITNSSRPKRPRGSQFWNDRNLHPKALGCMVCPQANVCGGLHVRKSIFDCSDYCCGGLPHCDFVCKKNIKLFVDRVREVKGFSLENVPRATPVLAKQLPMFVPVIFNGYTRSQGFEAPTVYLPFSAIFDRRKPSLRFQSYDEVLNHFRVGADTRLLLVGTEKDKQVEHWWAFSDGRIQLIQDIRNLGIEMVTTPNFSVMMNVPRTDDMYSMKRIAIVHEEFLRGGLRAALHLNARTETDWERWIEYIANREEIQDVSFEFTTGAGRPGRVAWYIEHLCDLSKNVPHKLHLTVRAAPVEYMGELVGCFDGVTFLDTNAFIKTMKRKRAILSFRDGLDWTDNLTTTNQEVDDLLNENWCVMQRYLTWVLESTNNEACTL